MSNVISRDYCPKCGSSDNLITWDDGHSYCFTPGCSNQTKGSGMHKSEDKPFTPIKGRPIAMHGRRLTANTCSKYGVVALDNRIYFPYYDINVLKGYKVINPTVPKKHKYHYYVKGSVNGLLFGSQCIHNTKVVAITAGEYDAMSVLQMTNVTGLSLAGDKHAERAIKYNLKRLETFDKIVLCIEDDTSGQQAKEVIKSIIRPHQLHIMVIPSGFKDANDLLMADEIKLFTRAFWAAKPAPITTAFTRQEFQQQLTANYKTPEGLSTGIDKLDTLLGGLRPAELTSILAKPGIGKSTLSRVVISNLVREKHQTMVFALEEDPIKYGRRLLHSFAGRSLISIPREQRRFLAEQLSTYCLMSKANGITDIKGIVNDIEYASRLEGIKVVLVDNVTAGINTSKIYEETSDYVSQLATVAKKFSLHILLVCHLGRKVEDPMDGGYGSGIIEKMSDNILSLIKEEDSNKLTIRLLKNRELGLPNNSYITLNYVKHQGRYEDKEIKQRRAGNIRPLPSSTHQSSLEESTTPSRSLHTQGSLS